jgi:hypothetical protein
MTRTRREPDGRRERICKARVGRDSEVTYSYRTEQVREPTDEFNDLTSTLETLERGIEERFPDARMYVRIGLDVPVT